MRLNVGCGKRILDGWVNCDIARDPEAEKEPEILCDAKQIPLEDECADVLQAIHLFEHFYRWQIDDVLKEWKRLLKPGGLLILELPNLVKCCQNYLEGRMRGGKNPDQLSRWGIYGDPRTGNPYMNHPWGYSPDELISILQEAGFRKAAERQTEFHPAGRHHRDMRIEAVK
jgi:ubiquinone/menaquinone biosynthesis C-methylase UbiE